VILTVDVEYDWGYETLDNLVFLRGLFDFLDDSDSSATVFIAGNIAEKVEEVGVSKRVEIASHSMTHPYMRTLTEEEVLSELQESKVMLEKVFNTKVHGFRAPYFMPPENLWILLRDLGYTYSSSLVAGRFPGKYNNKISNRPFEKDGIKEYPIQGAKLLKTPFGFPFMRFLHPFSKVFIPNELYMFYYNLSELLEKRPGPKEPIYTRLLYGIRRGRKARKILYNFLNENVPTKSIRDSGL